jgi:hypothetical protein
MANCNFHGDANGNVLMSGGTTWAGNRTSPPHGGPGQHPTSHHAGHHGYHGQAVADNVFTIDTLLNRPGAFYQTCCYTTMWPTVPKYDHFPISANPVQLFTQWPPYIYSTLDGIQIYCLDPNMARKGRQNELLGEMNIYPNPASSLITVKNVNVGSLIKVVDMVGGVMKIEKSNGVLQDIDIKTFPPGIYFIYIDNMPAKKFVKI